MLINVGCVLSHVLRVVKDRLIDLIHLALKKVSLFEFGMEVSNLLLGAQWLSLVSEVVLQGAHSRRLLHAAVIGSALGILLGPGHL